MKNNSAYIFVFFISLILILAPVEVSAQCSMCKEAAASSLKANPNSMARSLNSGILYLMAVPYVMLMFIFRKQVVQVWKYIFRRFSKNTAA